MVTQKLLDYIATELKSGKSLDEIQAYLTSNGWAERDVKDAFHKIENNTQPTTQPQTTSTTPTALTSLPSIEILLQDSWQLFKKTLLPFLKLTGITILLSTIPILILILIIGFILSGGLAGLIKFNVLTIILYVCYFTLAFVITYIVLIAEISILDTGTNISFKAILNMLKQSIQLILPLFIVNLITGLIIGGGALVLIIPGIFFSIYFAFVSYIVVLENKRGISALRTSLLYVESAGFLKILLRVFLIGIIEVLFSALAKNSYIGGISIILIILFNVFSQVYLFTLYKQAKSLSAAEKAINMRWIWISAGIGWLIMVALLGFLLFSRPQSTKTGYFPAINEFASSNNAKRRADIGAILNAISQYAEINNGSLPSQIDANAKTITSTKSPASVDLCSVLVPTYLVDLPIDPNGTKTPANNVCTVPGTSFNSGYSISVNSLHEVTVNAQYAELGKKISVTRKISVSMQNIFVLTPTPAFTRLNTTLSPKSPSASLLSLTKIGDCQWVLTFSLQGFTPGSVLTVSSSGTKTDCATSVTTPYSWTHQYGSIASDSTDTVVYQHVDYGDYNYTFTDSMGNTAAVPVSYSLTSTTPSVSLPPPE